MRQEDTDRSAHRLGVWFRAGGMCAEQWAGPPGVCGCFGLAGALMSAKGLVNIVGKLLQKESVSADVSIKLFGSFLYN